MAERNQSVKVKGEFLVNGMLVNELDKEGGVIGTHYLEDLFKDLDGEVVTFTAAVKEEIKPADVDTSEVE